MLSIFKRSLFMRSEIAAERVRDRFAEIGCCMQCEQPELMAGSSFRRSGLRRPHCALCSHL